MCLPCTQISYCHRGGICPVPSVRLSQTTPLQLNALGLKVNIEHVGSVVVDDDARRRSEDVGEIAVRGRQGPDPRVLGDVPLGGGVDEDVDRRRGGGARRRVARDGAGPGGVAAEFPGEVRRVLCLDVAHDGRLGYEDRGSEGVAAAGLRGVAARCAEQKVRF